MNHNINNSFFDSHKLKSAIHQLFLDFPFLKIASIGKSVMNNDITCIKIGTGSKKLFFFASIHANELITTNFLLSFIYDISSEFHLLQDLFSRISIFIIPLANPDGADLFLDKIPHTSSYYLNCLNISKNYPSIPFPSGWKSNISGVDLNLQFPAFWENAKAIKNSLGFDTFAPRDFVGTAPLFEPESKALHDFSLELDFDLAICLHTQGEEIYYEFQGIIPDNSLKIGSDFSKLSGYALKTVPPISSFAGYKDWFIKKYNRPCFTIEARITAKTLFLFLIFLPFTKKYNQFYFIRYLISHIHSL